MNKCKNDNTIRPKIASFETLYREEYKVRVLTQSPVEIAVKPINFSYIGSVLSTGTNLQAIDTCSINLIYHIPFAFIPQEYIFSPEKIQWYIESNIKDKIYQCSSRTTRQKGDKFKILMLGRCLVPEKFPKNLTRLYLKLLEPGAFQEKF